MTRASAEDDRSSGAQNGSATNGTAATPTAPGTPALDPTAQPPDKNEYCPAFEKIKAGGFESQADENADGQVDLDELERKFDELLKKYRAAERVSPVSLRDNYAEVLGFLQEGRKAVRSGDVDQLKALVSNLDTLNTSMKTIQTESGPFCK